MSDTIRIATVFICVFFFLQAGDGIRDLVRSRWLGDVYKRQGRDAVHGGHVVVRRERVVVAQAKSREHEITVGRGLSLIHI